MSRRRSVQVAALGLLALATGSVLGLAIASVATATGTAAERASIGFDVVALPRAEVAAFLRSRVGILATVGVAVLVMVVTFAAAWVAIRRAEPAPAGPTSKRAARRRRSSTSASGGAVMSSRFTASWLIAGALLLPLAFTIALADVFALPKTIVLRALALGTGVVLVAALLGRARIARLEPVDIALGVFIVLTAAATILSDTPALSLYGFEMQHQGFLAFAAYVVLFVGARFALADAFRVRLLSIAALVAASIASVYAIAQWVGLDPIWDTLFKGRVFSTVGQANALGSTLATALALSISLIPNLSRRSRWALVCVDMLIGFALLLTFSRGGYLALVVGAAVAALILAPAGGRATIRPVLPRIAAIVGAVVVVLALLTVAWRPAGQFIGQVASRAASIANPSESSNVSHIDLWTVGARIALDHPLIGTGLDTYVDEFPKYRDVVLRPERAAIMARFGPESPHNVYLAIAGGAGVFALAAYLTVIGATFYSALRASRRSLSVPERVAMAALAAAATVHLVTDSFMTGEPGSSAVFWIILGSMAGLAGRLRASAGRPVPESAARPRRP